MAEEIKFPRLSSEDISTLVKGLAISTRLNIALYLITNQQGSSHYRHLVNNLLQGISICVSPIEEDINSTIHALTTYMKLLEQYPDFARAEETTEQGYFQDLHMDEPRKEIHEIERRLASRLSVTSVSSEKTRLGR